MNDIENNNVTISEELEKQVLEKVKTIQNYFHMNNHSYDGIENEVNKAVELIDKLPESKAKHTAYTNVYLTAIHSFNNTINQKEYIKRGLQEAELSENAQAMVDFISQETRLHPTDPEIIVKIEQIMTKVKNIPDSECPLGQLYYYRGVAYYNTVRHQKDNMDKAQADFTEALKMICKKCNIRGSVLAELKRLEIEKSELDKSYDVGSSWGCEMYHFQNGKFNGKQNLMFHGHSSQFYEPNNLFGFVTNQFDSSFFYDDTNIGKETEMQIPVGSTMTLISKKEKVVVLAGEFDDCIHVEFKGSSQIPTICPFATTQNNIILYRINAYYAKNVGVVKVVFVMDEQPIQNYELYEYKINNTENMGIEYMPLAEGNVWKYTNTSLSSVYWRAIEREIFSIYINELNYTITIFANNNFFRLRKVEKFDDECDSDTYIKLACRIKHSVSEKTWDFESVVKCLKYAIQKNSSIKSSLFALNAVEYIEKYNETKEKRYLLPHSAINDRVIYKNKTEDKIKYENVIYSLSPYIYKTWDLLDSEKKVLGINPFSSLQKLAGTIFSEKWTIGYSEQKNLEEISLVTWYDENGKRRPNKLLDFHIKVEDGGTITVKSGTFENCLKVTFNWQPDDIDNYRYNLKNNFAMTYNYGTKIYYYAPNVGIVRHDCIWDESLSSICELTEYKSAATDGEYMPIYLGNCWIYEETTLKPIYKAKAKYDIVSSVENEFFMIEEQEFMYLGTEKEYEEFKKMVASKK